MYLCYFLLHLTSFPLNFNQVYHYDGSYLLGDVCGRGWRSEAQLVEGVEAERVDVALLGEHHRVVFRRRHLGAAVRHQALHHARDLGRQTGGDTEAFMCMYVYQSQEVLMGIHGLSSATTELVQKVRR